MHLDLVFKSLYLTQYFDSATIGVLEACCNGVQGLTD